ncbi:MAG: amino acid ABC transporter substrate-binding protein [Candidatus Rokubacteria bacterium]|nr:amino acid ABC transporter substrate-binding protein [Candidatus Rokubacteria bacterium]
MHRNAAGALIVVLALVLSRLPGDAQAPLRIGASISLTGTYASLGQMMKRGYDVCLKDVNAKGGALGRKVELVSYDDRSDPGTGVKLYEKLITEDKVDGVIGPYSSAITEAVANVTEKYKKVMLTPLGATSSIFKKGRRYVIGVITPSEAYLEGLIDIAARRGAKTAAFIYEDTLFPKSSVRDPGAAVDIAKKKGLQVTFVEAYPKGTTDFAALITKLKAAGPDVFGAATYFDDAVALTRQMKELNFSPKAYGVTVGGDLPKFYELLKQNAEYVYGPSQWETGLPYPGEKEFVEAFRQQFKEDPSYHAASSYSGCQIYVDAVRRAGSIDADRVREVLLKLETRTTLGDFKVDQDGLQIAHKMVTFQWQDGKKIIVWPDELASGKPRYPTPAWTQR